MAAKIDTSKFEKLKDRRQTAYNKELMRAEERFSEELVIWKRGGAKPQPAPGIRLIPCSSC